MKRAIILLSVLLLFAGQVAWADEESLNGILTTDGKYHYIHPETFDTSIRKWAATGEICRILGHKWTEGPSDAWVREKLMEKSGTHATIIYVRDQYQHCQICGKTEDVLWEKRRIRP